MTEFLFSRAGLRAISGAPEDAVVFWDRQGLIIGEQHQPRGHKRYVTREVKIAALLNELRHFGLNVSAMRSIISQLRAALDLYDSLAKPRHWLDVIDEDPEHIAENLRALSIPWSLTPADIDALVAVREAIPTGRERHVWIAYGFESDAQGELIVGHDGAGNWRLGTSVTEMFEANGTSALAIDLGRLFDLPWPSRDDERAN